MHLNRRAFLKGIGGALALPLLEANAASEDKAAVPMRFLVVGNPLGMHPAHFFPEQFGTQVELPDTLRSLNWMKDRVSILSHTDHGMNNGHGREISFLNGILPENALAYPEKNLSIDQLIAQRSGSRVRFPSIHAALERGIRMSWNANGVDLKPFTDPQRLFDHLFLNLSAEGKRIRRNLIERNGRILDTVGSQLSAIRQRASTSDQNRLNQYETSIRELEESFSDRKQWIAQDKPSFDISEHFANFEVTVENRYNAIFDMVAYAFQTDLTRVATVAFPNELRYRRVPQRTPLHRCRRRHPRLSCLHSQWKERRRHRRVSRDRILSNRPTLSLPSEA